MTTSFLVHCSWIGLAILLGGCDGPVLDAKADSVAAPPKTAAEVKATVKAAESTGKILRVAFPVAETGFDPVRVHDLYSNTVVEAIFDRLVTYDYLARPVRLAPMTVETMPEVKEDGKLYLFHLKKGIYFNDDPAFKGKKRELVAEDYIYTLKRFMDPKNRSVWQFLIEGKIVGLDEVAAEAKKSNVFNYDKKVEGLQALDRYTLQIKLKTTDYNFLNILAMPTFGAVAREVVETYPNDTNAHPVGTGPYKIKEWVRSSRILLDRNPSFQRFTWHFQAGTDPQNLALDQAIVAANKGKLMPAIDQIDIRIMEEGQSRWLAFQNGELDILNMPLEFAPIALPNNKVSADLAKKGVLLNQTVDPEITYTYFNMQEKVDGKPNPVAGFVKDRIALRRAVAMAYNVQEEIDQIRKGQAIVAQQVVPLNLPGNDPNYFSSVKYNLDLANKLLDKFGFKKGADGFRTNPDGSPLTLTMYSTPTALDRQFDELWDKSMKAIGIRFKIEKDKFSELLKREKQCQLMMRQAAWIADYPDGENFVQLLYGPNIHQSNNACLQFPEMDRRYQQIKTMPDSPERTKLMLDMAKLVEYYAPWVLHISRYRSMLYYPRVQGYKKHPILHAEWIYLDLDASKTAS